MQRGAGSLAYQLADQQPPPSPPHEAPPSPPHEPPPSPPYEPVEPAYEQPPSPAVSHGYSPPPSPTVSRGYSPSSFWACKTYEAKQRAQLGTRTSSCSNMLRKVVVARGSSRR